MWVIVTSVDEKYWDDGPEEVIGPFPTKEAAEFYADQNIVSAWLIFELRKQTT